MKRRAFIKSGILGSLALTAVAQQLAANQKHGTKPGLQVYTVRKELTADPIGTLKSLAEIGISSIEGYVIKGGLYLGADPYTFKQAMAAYHLDYISCHVPLRGGDGCNLTDGIDLALGQAKELGIRFIVLPSLPKKCWEDPTEWQKVLAEIKTAQQKVTQAGFQFAFHNHAVEFENKLPSGATLYDAIIEAVPDLKLETDIYWVHKAGLDISQYFDKYGSKVILWHVKNANEKGETVEVGNGVLKFRQIFMERTKTQLAHWFIEQDNSVNAIESVRQSVMYANTFHLH